MTPIPPASRSKLVREISFSLIFLGLILVGLGYLSLTGIDASAPRMMGYPRHLAIAIPLFSLGGIHVLCGILFLATKMNSFAVGGAVAAALMSVGYFFLIGFKINILSLAVAAMPVLLGQRLSVLLKASDSPPPDQP